jgi:hypothetical protein
MLRRRFQIIAILLAAASVGELFLSVLAVGHRHTCQFHVPALTKTLTGCSHHHGHEHPASESHGVAPIDGGDSKQSSEDSCSICRYLAQPALATSWIVESSHEPLIEVIVPGSRFDVATPAHLFPQPRSPPVAA